MLGIAYTAHLCPLLVKIPGAHWLETNACLKPGEGRGCQAVENSRIPWYTIFPQPELTVGRLGLLTLFSVLMTAMDYTDGDGMIHSLTALFLFPSYTLSDKIKVVFAGSRQIPQIPPQSSQYFKKSLQCTKKQ